MANVPHPESRRTFVSSGSFQIKPKEPSDAVKAGSDKLDVLASSHPLTRQLDAVFPIDSPSAGALQSALSQLTTKYHRIRVGLAEFIAAAGSHVSRYALESDLVATGRSPKGSPTNSDAVWCLDTRGIVTIAVGSAIYQRLGLIGLPLPWKAHEDTFVIQISLRPHTSSESNKQSYILPFNAKVKAALEAWDKRLEDFEWEVVYCCVTELAHLDAKAEAHIVKPKFRTSSQFLVPEVSLECPKGEEEREEWDEAMASILEWSGLACMGSQRLQASDKPDPFIAVYALPTSHRIADIQHFRWTGLIPPAFVQSVLDICRGASFLSLTANAVIRSPVTYLSPLSPHRSFLRAPREESEDVWTLLLQSSSGNDTGRWLLAESVGKFDTRWG